MKRAAALILFAGLLLAQSVSTPLTPAQLAAYTQAKADLQAAIKTYNAAVAAIAGPPSVIGPCVGGQAVVTTNSIVGTSIVSVSRMRPCSTK